jgi:hypothetical protein
VKYYVALLSRFYASLGILCVSLQEGNVLMFAINQNMCAMQWLTCLLARVVNKPCLYDNFRIPAPWQKVCLMRRRCSLPCHHPVFERSPRVVLAKADCSKRCWLEVRALSSLVERFLHLHLGEVEVPLIRVAGLERRCSCVERECGASRGSFAFGTLDET